MQIVIDQDEPSGRLVLEERNERMPLRFVLAGLALTLLIAAPWRTLWHNVVGGGEPVTWDPVPSALVLIAGVYFILLGRGGTRLERLVVDREAGKIEWRRTFLAGLVSWTRHVSLDAVDAVTVERDSGELKEPSKLAKPRPLGLTLGLSLRGRGAVRLTLSVEGIHDVARLDHFASRLASAFGLAYFRVLRNDPFAHRIELRRDDAQGAKPAEGLREKASRGGEPHDGTGDGDGPDITAPFDPAAFRGSMTIAKWEPGRDVRFKKGWTLYVLLAPLLVGPALPLWAWLRLPSLHEGDLLPRLVALAMITLTGLALGLVGLVGLLSGLPREVRLDWTAKQLAFSSVWSKRLIPFADVKSIEMRGRIYRHRSNRLYTTWYVAAVRVLLQGAKPGGSHDELLVDTLGSKDPAEPASMALPLANTLAVALGVPLVRTQEPSS